MLLKREITDGERKVEIVDAVVCNKCGGSCRNELCSCHGTKPVFDFTELVFKTGNYGSQFDGVFPHDEPVHLCDNCCIQLLLQLNEQPRWCNQTPRELWGKTK